jgi:lactoylglutathione lyase
VEVTAVRLAATGIVVQDLDHSVRFYTEVIGMQEVQRVDVPHLQLREAVLNFGGRGAALVLMEYAAGADPADRGSPGAPGGKIVVWSEEPAALVQAVRAAGGTVVREPRDTPFGVIGFVRDPDGTAIEIVSQGRQSRPQA